MHVKTQEKMNKHNLTNANSKINYQKLPVQNKINGPAEQVTKTVTIDFVFLP